MVKRKYTTFAQEMEFLETKTRRDRITEAVQKRADARQAMSINNSGFGEDTNGTTAHVVAIHGNQVSSTTTFGFDEESGEYVSTTTTRSKQPFAMRQRPYKNRFLLAYRAISPKHGFMQLPPEVRARIYEYMLGPEHPFTVLHERRNYKADVLTVRRCENYKHSKPSFGIRSTALMRTSSQTFEEMAAMLYGRDVFSFDTTPDFIAFANTIQANVNLLRHVRLIDLQVSSIRKALHILKDAPNLASLTFDTSEVGSDTVNEYFINSIRPFLKQQYKLREKIEKGTGCSILDRIQVASQWDCACLDKKVHEGNCEDCG